MTREERNALRGVVIHCCRMDGQRVRYSHWTLRDEIEETLGRFDRDLVGAFYGRREAAAKRCVWCRQPVERSKRWHRLCVVYHAAARGLVQCGLYDTIERDGRPVRVNALWPSKGAAGCAECGGAEDEIDHFLPLAVAHEVGHRWAVRAHLPGNLRWLCRSCHRAKTKRDAALLAALRRPRPRLPAVPVETPLLDALEVTT